MLILFCFTLDQMTSGTRQMAELHNCASAKRNLGEDECIVEDS